MNVLIGLMLQALVVVNADSGDTRALCFPLQAEEDGKSIAVISEVNCNGHIENLIEMDAKVIALQDGDLYRCGTPANGRQGAFIITLSDCKKADSFRWWWE